MPLRDFAVKLLWTGAAIVALAVAAGLSTSIWVARSAAEIAGSEPYCIQVASDDYRPARSWLDLSALRMRAKREAGRNLQHHAVLVVGSETKPSLFHWSYRRREFVAVALGERLNDLGYGPALTCVPKHDFMAGLPMVLPAADDGDYVRFSATEAYRIPKAYQSQWKGGPNRFLRLGTAAPDFLPLQRRWNDLAPGERDTHWVIVGWNPGWLLGMMQHGPGGEVVERGIEGGLLRIKTVSTGPDLRKHEHYQYSARAYPVDESGAVNTTLIRCGTPTQKFPKSCQHRFLKHGRHFYFRHGPEDVPDWREMQKRLLDLFATFEVRPP